VPERAGSGPGLGLAPRPETLEGRRVGLLWTSKMNGDVFLERIAELLEHSFEHIRVLKRAKPTSEKPVPETTLDELRTCDAVVVAFGDCGSCSSWTIADGVTLEGLEVPTVSVTSEPFGFKTRIEVEAMGVPSLPIQILPHPVGQLPRDEMYRIADAAFDEIVFCLTGNAEKVAEAYSKRSASRSVYQSAS
jgi:hypothetical protein